MNITEWKLTIEGVVGETTVRKSLTYRGNENIIFEDSDGSNINGDNGDGKETIIMRFPRHILNKFMEMIE